MGGLAAVAGRALDPLNITGLADSTDPRPAPVGAQDDVPSFWNDPLKMSRQAIAASRGHGYLSSMIPEAGANQWRTGNPIAPPPPPPSQWAYDPGKGVSWATPQRKGTSHEYEMTNNAPGSEGFNSFKGNRI